VRQGGEIKMRSETKYYLEELEKFARCLDKRVDFTKLALENPELYPNVDALIETPSVRFGDISGNLDALGTLSKGFNKETGEKEYDMLTIHTELYRIGNIAYAGLNPRKTSFSNNYMLSREKLILIRDYGTMRKIPSLIERMQGIKTTSEDTHRYRYSIETKDDNLDLRSDSEVIPIMENNNDYRAIIAVLNLR
jgi:hypothetical protein